MTYKEEITPKGHKYKIYTIKGKIIQMNFVTHQSFNVFISTNNDIIKTTCVASGLKGYDISHTNEYIIAESEIGIKYIRSKPE